MDSRLCRWLPSWQPLPSSPTSIEAGFLEGDALLEFAASRRGARIVGENRGRQFSGKNDKDKGGREVRDSGQEAASGPRVPCSESTQPFALFVLVFIFFSFP